MSDAVEQVPLHRATAERYLSYALSVITSRALPDVRDGLKPVQRRILYAMYADLGLVAGGRYSKCAGVVGEVIKTYHPHGDSSIYEALVRMAQDFSLRSPLIDGQGNFGSLDGDPPAAYRYTECKLRPLAEELASEIKKGTVDFRPTFDGQKQEPLVLPAQFPNLLVNGSEGIAVGMATRIPPHNLAEVVDAAIALSEDRGLTVRDLLVHVKGPDFPTGGQILASPAEIAQVYETGQGTLKVRGTWHLDQEGRRRQLVIDSIPYGQNKAKIVEHIGEEVRTKRLPQVVDVRDESTDVVRIVLDLKSDADPDVVMAYLFKRTDLAASWPVNLTALVPTRRSADEAEALVPGRLDLKAMLEHWLDFRLETVRRRYQFDLNELRERIHLLEGFEKLFDGLDDAIRIIRESEGRKDAATQLIARFDLSELQADAILELRLYKLARLEIAAIREELAEKRAEADRLEKLIASEKRLWGEVRRELKELRKHYADPRRTTVGTAEKVVEFDEDVFIVDEDAFVVVTRDGWIKRQSTFSELSKIRVRDGDELGWLVRARTRSPLTVFTNLGSAYTIRVDAVPATAGYGDPLQAQLSFADGERVVGVASHDPRHRPAVGPPADDDPPGPYAVCVTAGGRGMRFPLDAHAEQSNKSGRRYARLDEGDQVFAVYLQSSDADRVCLASKGARTLVYAASHLPVLKAAGKGVTAIKLRDDAEDTVVAFELAPDADSGPTVVTSLGRELTVREATFGLGERGGKGHVVLRRGSIDVWRREPRLLRGPEPEVTVAKPEQLVED
ncbi:MAG: DNA topoisomerase IV subunit A [Myxococcota bacterium]